MNKKTKIVVIVVAAAAVAAGAGLVLRRRAAAPAAAPAAQAAGYHCPMHPTYHSDKPGSCPICNMSLVPDEPAAEAGAKPKATAKHICLLHKCTMSGCMMELAAEVGQKVTCPVCGTAEAASAAPGTILYYRNPMNPSVTSLTPQKDEMGMDYVPVYAEDVAAAGDKVPGQGALALSAEKRQAIGMRSEAVEPRDLSVVVRATGQVAYDPELYNAINEYGEAAKARAAVQDSPYADVIQRADALLRASDLRLRQLGLSPAQIAAIARSTQAPTNLLFSGPGGSVWVYAQVYEYEIPLVKPGQAAEIATLAYPGRKFRGTVRSLDPILSQETRSLRVRIEVPNPDGALALQMYADAAIHAGIGRKLALPASALIDTGERQLVFVDLGDGRLEPRQVAVGRQAGGYYEVVSGLKQGERVVTSANFLIDSESKLRAAAPAAGSSGGL